MTADQVFNHHPTGELFQVIDWFIQCAVQREFDLRVAAGEDPNAVNLDQIGRIPPTPWPYVLETYPGISNVAQPEFP